ncbi:unnamed protein product [Moneuplotes crassus]|uniref:Uncharacterized protein n=1 Tax=Euplotes crassus TaxID=5936 RepID=A0AAD1XCQ8_EUPCR|nr:unnamed protein product [Moneuplotes crassus]
MSGTIRYYDEEVRDKVVERIHQITENVSKAFNCKGTVNADNVYPAVLNHEKQTEIVLDIAEKELGEEGVNTTKHLPWFASEDFSFFLQKIPGTFILLNNVKPGDEPVSLHSSYMDYNDHLTPTGAYLNIRILENRLGFSVL